MCLRYYIKLIWESPTTRIKWPLGWPQPQVFQGYFFNSYNIQCNVHASFLAHRAAPMTKTYLIFPGFFLRFVDFAVQFCFRCAVSFHSTRNDARVRCDSGVIFLDQPEFFTAQHSNQWDCFIVFVWMIDYVKWVFSCLPKWAKAGFRAMLKDFEIKKEKALSVAIASCANFCSYHILTSSVIYYWTDARHHGIY